MIKTVETSCEFKEVRLNCVIGTLRLDIPHVGCVPITRQTRNAYILQVLDLSGYDRCAIFHNDGGCCQARKVHDDSDEIKISG